MHPSVLDFLRRALTPADVLGRDVLEVGSMDINGSPRSVVERLRPRRYVGADAEPGRGVDLVCPAERLLEVAGAAAWDIVISTEMLEHAEDWRAVVRVLKRLVRPGGLILVTARGPGFPYHPHPGDFWRFTPDDFRRAFGDLSLEVLERDPGQGFPGVLMRARAPAENGPEASLDFDVARVERPPK